MNQDLATHGLTELDKNTVNCIGLFTQYTCTCTVHAVLVKISDLLKV